MGPATLTGRLLDARLLWDDLGIAKLPWGGEAIGAGVDGLAACRCEDMCGWGAAMALTYFKRFRMEMDLARCEPVCSPLPDGYRMVPWSNRLTAYHAQTKYLSFRCEIDADVFPCLGQLSGCQRLMDEIRQRQGFLPGATWLLEYIGTSCQRPEYCGTVQGVRNNRVYGSIQNLGVTPHHRGQGLGTALMVWALAGFRRAGLRRAYLEVTAENEGAVRLYQRIGFVRSRTLYKAVEAVCT